MDDLGELLFWVLYALIAKVLPKRFQAWLDRQHKYVQNFFVGLICVFIGVLVMIIILLLVHYDVIPV